MMMNVMSSTQAGKILYGICCSSFEWGSVTGTGGTDFVDYLNQTVFASKTVPACTSRRMGIIRLQVRQERLQSTFYATMNNTSNAGGPVNYYNNMISYVKAANAVGITVVISPHNFNEFYNGDGAGIYGILGDTNFPVAAMADFWYQMGLLFRHNPMVWFNLTNEPRFEKSCSTVAGYWNTIIAKIRESGFAGRIVCPSTGYCGAINWVSEGAGAAMSTLKDPCNNIVWEVHNYGDTSGSGSPADHVNSTILRTRLTDVVNDCRKYKFKLMLGETNYNEGGANATSSFIDQMAYIDKNRDVIVACCQWAQGNFIYPEGGCLSADSKVLTPYGSERIADLVGVDAWIHNGKEWEVNNTFALRGYDSLSRVWINDRQFFDANPTHRHFVDGQETLTVDLKVGMNLDSADGRIKRVSKIEELPGIHPVYCPTVASTGKFTLESSVITGNSQTLTPNGSLWDSSGNDTVRLGPWKPYLGLP